MLRQLARKVNKAVVFYAKELLLTSAMRREYAPAWLLGEGIRVKPAKTHRDDGDFCQI